MTKFAFLILTMSASTAVLAENTAPTYDPNEIVCRTVSVTGSRLGASRRCATRTQWAEDERMQRTVHNERTLRQVNPQDMNAAERAFANGRYIGTLTRPGAPR